MVIPYALLQVIVLPLVAAGIVYVFGNRLGRRVGWVAFIAILYATLLLLLTGAGIYGGGGPVKELYPWAPSVGLTFGFLADNLSLPVALVMSLVCAGTSVYSMPYMKHRLEAMYGEEKKQQFAVYYVNFLLLDVGLIGVSLSTNLIELYMFVELMLIPSFLLMSLFGYVDRERIAIMYVIWNHLGAFLFLGGIVLTYVVTGSFEVAALSTLQPGTTAYWIVGLILIGWLVKMAIFGLHMWLPPAHAEHPTSFAPIMATIVGVGNYVLARLLVGEAPSVFQPFAFPLMVMALITMVYGGAVTLVQNDIKYLYAWSTISQNAYSLLGIASLTTLGVAGGVFYFLSHIVGKCILFSVAGIVLTETGLRDIRKMGGLATRMPLTATLCVLGTLILSAVPPLSGFQAEWILFVGVFTQGTLGSAANMAVAVLAIIGTVLTVGYTFWPLRKIFFGALPPTLAGVHEAPPTMLVPLFVLAAIMLIVGIYPDLIMRFLSSFVSGLPIR
ncbi:MAG: complex I subunit 5 family protein [Nitrososphaerales archaeon]|nr:complex I subunit 5 family protein [Nitrososphaerales archaeon]